MSQTERWFLSVCCLQFNSTKCVLQYKVSRSLYKKFVFLSVKRIWKTLVKENYCNQSLYFEETRLSELVSYYF